LFKRKNALHISVMVLVSLLITACQPIQMPAGDETGMGGHSSGEQGATAFLESYFEINDQGELLRPDFNFREEWVYVGTPVTPNDLNDGQAPFPEFHNVYIDPKSYAAFKETGEYPEGTILLKELVSVGAKSAPSGNGYFMGEFIGLEATIKSAEYFPDEPGYWAYFSFTNSEGHGGPLSDTAAPFPTESCNACHELFASETDFVFQAYYPVLRAAHAMDEASMDEAAMGHGGMAGDAVGLELEFTGLGALGEGWQYEGWLIVDGAPVSAGLFTVDSEGNLSDNAFALDSSVADATAFVLTIEPSPDPDPAPSAVHILGGDIVDGVAELSIGHPAALGTDFADATGSYILGIGYPAGATDANSYDNGIWWFDDSLNLPALPEGWLYEGWVVGPDGPISTGRFADGHGMDDDGSGPTAGGSGTGPDDPGQDFLDPPMSIIGFVTVISVEPEPDDSPAPFDLKPLIDMEIEDVGDHGSQDMMNNAAASPTGVAKLLVQ